MCSNFRTKMTEKESSRCNSLLSTEHSHGRKRTKDSLRGFRQSMAICHIRCLQCRTSSWMLFFVNLSLILQSFVTLFRSGHINQRKYIHQGTDFVECLSSRQSQAEERLKNSLFTLWIYFKVVSRLGVLFTFGYKQRSILLTARTLNIKSSNVISHSYFQTLNVPEISVYF